MSFLSLIKKLAISGEASSIPMFSKDDVKTMDHKELCKLHDVVLAPHASLALAVLQNSGFFSFFIPEIDISLNLISDKEFKQIWPHTLKVVNQTPNDLCLRWAALFHDLGKAEVFEIIDNKVTFHGHEIISAKIFNRFSKRTMIFNKEDRDKIHFLIKNLGYIEAYEKSWTDSAVRRFAKEIGPYLNDLLILSQADITTKYQAKKDKILNRIKDLKLRIDKITKEDSEKNVLPKGIGQTISEEFNIPLGPEIGKIRTFLENKIKNNEILPKQDINFISLC
jgi:poly(A) polymerase